MKVPEFDWIPFDEENPPSIPVSVRIGKNTIRMMSTAKVELFITFEAPSSTSCSISAPDNVFPARRLE